MNVTSLVIKSAWRAIRLLGQKRRLWLYQALPGVFFTEIGAGTRIYGRIRFGNIPSRIIVGRRCMLGADLFLSAGNNGRICLGDKVSLNTGCHIVSGASIHIGDNTLIGEYVSIRDEYHVFGDVTVPIRQQGFSAKPIRIGQDVWIGRGAFVGPGVNIGDGCVIGANSVVVKSLPAYVVAAGAPAVVIRERT